MRKICVVTGSRAEYGLLYWLMKEINSDLKLQLQVVVTGMHLSLEFGSTYQEVEKDFEIDHKVEMDLSSDTSNGISKAMAFAQIAFTDCFEDLNPDLIVILGDRYEIFSAAISAMMLRIPIAHIHGGESTEGVIDESIRHSITKMSQLHFVATETYKNRVIQLGEIPNMVKNVGAIGIDNIKKLNLLSRKNFEKAIDFSLNKKNLIVTFHPVTLEKSSSKVQFQELLNALSNLTETNVIFTKANSDMDGRIINTMIDQYVALNKNAICFTSMGQLNYLSALQYVDAVVGNSSSGILEAPSFNIGTIDIGDRQMGRIKSDSVISCLPNYLSIQKAFNLLYEKDFKLKLLNVTSPYGNGGASKKIKEVIKSAKLKNILKKRFYDITY